jgi:hypothetical protein
MVTTLSYFVFNVLDMNNQNVISWVILLVLTLISGWVSSTALTYMIPLILVLAVLKIIGVAFNFMELKKANVFWKIVLVSYLVVFCGIILLINT